MCCDGKKNGMETDVDCGGPASPPCAVAKTCAVSTDCADTDCYDGKVCCDMACSGCNSCLQADTGMPDGTCAPVLVGHDPNHACMPLGGNCDGAGACACSSGCGGPCVAKCAPGKTCGVNADCQAPGVCAGGYCCTSTCMTDPCHTCGIPCDLGTCHQVPSIGDRGGCDSSHVCAANGMCMGGTVTGGTCGQDSDCASNKCSGTCQSNQPPGAVCCDSGECTRLGLQKLCLEHLPVRRSRRGASFARAWSARIVGAKRSVAALLHRPRCQ